MICTGRIRMLEVAVALPPFTEFIALTEIPLTSMTILLPKSAAEPHEAEAAAIA